ncbi:hypothetical protein SAMN05428989_2154 [Pseudoxanthomonas sp. GM95]|uniref:hypothetical protein n=1 Tax=Pseudoxanthomonas sp. GM95 TaxID=1881043 RepID=UPI0008C9F4A1|nr:hypothetical protein [Pseudoxanthomonas sp. GM95]SEL64991.1 hypothetical protein SAMN05428989_2154 [Pseudoxanthomonas sp. GM95]
MLPLARLYGQLAGLPIEILHAALAEYSCQDLQTLVYATHAPEAAVEAADIILAFRMSNLPQAAQLVHREDIVDALGVDMLMSILKRQADVTLHAFSSLNGDLEPVGALARELLQTRVSLSLELTQQAHQMLDGQRPE